MVRRVSHAQQWSGGAVQAVRRRSTSSDNEDPAQFGGGNCQHVWRCTVLYTAGNILPGRTWRVTFFQYTIILYASDIKLDIDGPAFDQIDISLAQKAGLSMKRMKRIQLSWEATCQSHHPLRAPGRGVGRAMGPGRFGALPVAREKTCPTVNNARTAPSSCALRPASASRLGCSTANPRSGRRILWRQHVIFSFCNVGDAPSVGLYLYTSVHLVRSATHWWPRAEELYKSIVVQWPPVSHTRSDGRWTRPNSRRSLPPAPFRPVRPRVAPWSPWLAGSTAAASVADRSMKTSDKSAWAGARTWREGNSGAALVTRWSE